MLICDHIQIDRFSRILMANTNSDFSSARENRNNSPCKSDLNFRLIGCLINIFAFCTISQYLVGAKFQLSLSALFSG